MSGSSSHGGGGGLSEGGSPDRGRQGGRRRRPGRGRRVRGRRGGCGCARLGWARGCSWAYLTPLVHDGKEATPGGRLCRAQGEARTRGGRPTARPRLSRNHSRGYGSACDEASGLGRKSRSFRYPHAYPMRCYLERGVIAAPPVQDHVDERVFLAHHDLVERRAQNPLTRKRLWRMEVTMPARDRHRAASTVVAPDRPTAEAWTQPWRRSRPLIRTSSFAMT